MDSEINFKELWQQQPTNTVTGLKEALDKAIRLNKKMKIRLVLLNVLMGLTLVWVAFVAVSYNWQMWTSKAGAALVIIAIALYLAVTNIFMAALFKPIPATDNQSYLKMLVTIQTKQAFLQQRLLTAYFILLSAGLLLYMIESVKKMGVIYGALAYLLVIVWIAFNWFYLRPKKIKKIKAEMESVIQKLQLVNGQAEQAGG